ncbi:MAG: hypothetical protein N3A02_01820 [Rectinema sp.]|nr:hypothetical protein [Rectinema sp.]
MVECRIPGFLVEAEEAMIFLERDSIGSLPLLVLASALGICILLLSATLWLIHEKPTIFAREYQNIHLNVQPGEPSEQYISSFARLYFERFVIWNRYTFRSNRQMIMMLSAKDLGEVIALETQQTQYVVSLLQRSQRARILDCRLLRSGKSFWVVQYDYQLMKYDGSVARPPEEKRMEIVLRLVTPTPEYPYGCEVIALSDRSITEIAPLTAEGVMTCHGCCQ